MAEAGSSRPYLFRSLLQIQLCSDAAKRTHASCAVPRLDKLSNAGAFWVALSSTSSSRRGRHWRVLNLHQLEKCEEADAVLRSMEASLKKLEADIKGSGLKFPTDTGDAFSTSALDELEQSASKFTRLGIFQESKMVDQIVSNCLRVVAYSSAGGRQEFLSSLRTARYEVEAGRARPVLLNYAAGPGSITIRHGDQVAPVLAACPVPEDGTWEIGTTFVVDGLDRLEDAADLLSRLEEAISHGCQVQGICLLQQAIALHDLAREAEELLRRLLRRLETPAANGALTAVVQQGQHLIAQGHLERERHETGETELLPRSKIQELMAQGLSMVDIEEKIQELDNDGLRKHVSNVYQQAIYFRQSPI